MKVRNEINVIFFIDFIRLFVIVGYFFDCYYFICFGIFGLEGIKNNNILCICICKYK